jgi:tetratricopeptide (TPR) repeat protein
VLSAPPRGIRLASFMAATVFLGSVYLVAEINVMRSIQTGDATLIDRSSQVLAPTPELEKLVLQVHAAGGPGSRDDRALDLSLWDTSEDETFVLLAEAQAERGRTSDAIASLDRAIALNPSSLTARLRRANLLQPDPVEAWQINPSCPNPAGS